VKRMRLLASFLLICSLLAYGCGGGGGGGGATSGTPTATTSFSNSTSAKSFIAKNIASNFNALNTEKNKLSLRRQLKTDIKIEDLDPATIKVTYGPADAVTSSLGVNYTYTGGYQIVRAKDILGNLALSAATTNTIEISSHGLACNYVDGGDQLSIVGNGKLILTGFLSNTTFTVAAEGLNVSGTINGADSFSLIIDDGSVSVTTASFPYPRSGESESGKIIFNGAQYNYSISYDGTKTSRCSISGAESFSFAMNMETGTVVEASQVADSSVYETGLASWYGDPYNGLPTASGELFDKTALTAAHKSLAFGTLVAVTNLENGRVVTVKINDRGPFIDSRIMDVSEKAADDLGMKAAGFAQVSLKIVGTAPIVKPESDSDSNDSDSDTNPYSDNSNPDSNPYD